MTHPEHPTAPVTTADSDVLAMDVDEDWDEEWDAGADEPSSRTVAWLLLIGGLLATVAAFALTVEKIALLEDPDYIPSCSFNPILNCGSIMSTDQASLFGFPNPLLGLVALPVLIATGAALLAGARLRRWYWIGLQAGVTLGAVFIGWLVFQSLYRINALCPYCMVVWAVMIPVFWVVTAHNAARGTFGERFRDARVGQGLDIYQPLLITLTYVLVIALITERFWDYWSSLLS